MYDENVTKGYKDKKYSKISLKNDYKIIWIPLPH